MDFTPALRRHIAFSLERDDSIGILEGVLAIARRGGLSLDAMQLRGEAKGKGSVRVCLGLRARQPELLALFVTRLHNVIGVANIADCAAATPAPAFLSARASSP